MYKFGCRKDITDFRDIQMGLVLPPISVPSELDYSKDMTVVRDQGNEGTCVAFASVVGVKEYQDTKEYKKSIGLSPRYLYSLCKEIDGIPNEEGTYPRIAMKVLLNNGVCPESYWPYKPYQNDKPKKDADTKAKVYRINAYARLKALMEMKRSLIVNGPFLAGVQVFRSWFTKKALSKGLIPMPGKDDILEGGHAICIVGYNDTQKLFKFKNSWGSQWGDKGYGYLYYDYMKKYCMDAWSATDLIGNPKAFVKKIEWVLRKFG